MGIGLTKEVLSLPSHGSADEVCPTVYRVQGEKQYSCRICNDKGTLDWSPLLDPVFKRPVLCPTCDGTKYGTLQYFTCTVYSTAL